MHFTAASRRRTWVAYVGMAGDLNRRLIQHFVNRDSSVVTGASAAGLNIDLVRRVDWWEHPSFGDGDALHAAELIAFEVLDPALRSRGNPRKNALTKVDDQAFRAADRGSRARRGRRSLPAAGPLGHLRPSDRARRTGHRAAQAAVALDRTEHGLTRRRCSTALASALHFRRLAAHRLHRDLRSWCGTVASGSPMESRAPGGCAGRVQSRRR